MNAESLGLNLESYDFNWNELFEEFDLDSLLRNEIICAV
jgi:hypothetical protein